MKRIILAALLISASIPAVAAETVGGKLACLNAGWYDDFVKFAAAKDEASMEAYFESRKCLQVKGGLKVTVIEYPGMLGGQWVVAFQGQKFVVQREGIKLED